MTKPLVGRGRMPAFWTSLNAELRSDVTDTFYWELMQECFRPLAALSNPTHWDLDNVLGDEE